MNAKTIYIAIGFAIAVGVAFAAGDSVGQRSLLAAVSIQLDGVQAMLAYNRLDDDRQLQVLLSKGCVAQARSFLDYYENRETQLLSEFFKGKLDAATIKYVTDRDSKLVASLSTFKSKYGSRWEEPDCK